MKIVSLTAENIKRLSAVEIRPDGNVVEITGRNGSGKTSVLDAIWWVLAGTRNVQAHPIRDGQDRARIRLDLGELIVTRTFSRRDGGEYATKLAVESADGAAYRSPQQMLDALVGELSFDPLDFARAKPAEQFARLAEFVDVDLDEVERLNQADYDERRDVNRDAKAKRAQADAIEVPADLPDEPVDESALVEQAEIGRQANDAAVNAAAKRERAAELRQQADALEVEARDLEAEGKRLRGLLPDVVPDLTESLARARETNQAIAERARKAELDGEASALEQKADELTKGMDARRQQVADAIAAADMPVQGLGLADGQVTLDGVPFEQASDAEQLSASVAIAMAANPTLRVIRVRDGSLLDEDSMRLLAEMADTQDCQVWVERVDSSGTVGVVIEDGVVCESAEGGDAS